jgi:hypothetical protein
MGIIKAFFVFTCVLFLAACSQGPDSPTGFSLPKGQQSAGEQAFYKYECMACHTLKGHEDRIVAAEIAEKVPLGGKVQGITTYAELVTSIINPSHKFSERLRLNKTSDNGMSKMTNYNDIMTVTELIDIVAFLQPQYEIAQYTPTSYMVYH